MKPRAHILLALLGASLCLGDAPMTELSMSMEVIQSLIESAPDGGVVRAPRGVYEGRLVIRKPVTLEADGRVVLDGGGQGIVVEILSPNVTVRGFEIRGSGSTVEREPAGIRAETGPVVIEGNMLSDVLFGIDLRSAPGSIVRGNTIEGKPLEIGRRGDGIRLWWSSDCTVEENVVHGVRDVVFWYSEGLQVRRNRVSDGRYGLHFMYSHRTLLAENQLTDNSVGVYLMYSNGITLRENLLARNRGPSGYGVGLKDCDDLLVEHNSILANRVGVYADNIPYSIGGRAEFIENLIAANESGLAFTTQTDGSLLVGNGFIDNEEQAAVLGRGNISGNQFARDGRGNFWSDYAGFDRDGDGVGELPYEAVSLFEDLLSREPNLRLFVHSPAQQAVEFTARALPEIRPEPKFTDPAPLMRGPTSMVAFEDGASRGSMALVSAVLALGGALLLASARRQGDSHIRKGREGRKP